MEEEDSRREAAIASTPSLRPDFKPNNTKITQSQLAKFQGTKKGKMEEEDSRREAAIASTPSLRPDFQPNNTKITQSQLAKFQELHRRRLQLKSKPKTKTKKKSKGKGHVVKESADDLVENSCVSISVDSNVNNNSSQQQETPKEPVLKKHRKLHWGLDTKERWERKSNM